jgi:hypothetical protein
VGVRWQPVTPGFTKREQRNVVAFVVALRNAEQESALLNIVGTTLCPV